MTTDTTQKNANAFASTFYFFAETQSNAKKIKRAYKPTHWGHCKLDTTDLRLKRSPAGNSTYKKLAVQWLNEALCFLASKHSEIQRRKQEKSEVPIVKVNVIYLADKLDIHNRVDFYEYQIEKSIGKPCGGKLQARFDAGGTDSFQ